MFSSCLFILFLLVTQDPNRLEEEIPKLMKKHNLPGLSMVLIRDNRITWKKAFGVRNAGQPEKVDENTIFEAASMSKPLYSYAVLKLMEDKKFDLDLPLDSYLKKPYLPSQPKAKQITARMVMLHRTGLPNWRKKGGPLKLTCDPNTKFTYSGEGFQYLQTAVANLTGQDMSPWVETQLLKPLNMTRSSYQWKEDFKENFAGGHSVQGELNKNRGFYKKGNAAYSLYTTPTDYAKFLMEMMQPDRTGKQSLTAKTLETMTTLQVIPEKDNKRTHRSLGWLLNPPWICHSGNNGNGFRCHSRFDPKKKKGCVIMTNGHSGTKVWEAVIKLLDAKKTNSSK